MGNKRKKLENRGETERISDYKKVYSQTGSHKEAIKSYVNGNKWATENARATGNI